MQTPPRARSILRALALLLAVASCDPGDDVVVTHPDQPPIAPFDECTVQTAREAATSASHVPPCSALDYDVPPSSGTHYAQWAAFGTYDEPVPWGFLVHALEHGAIVLSYRCEAGADCTEIRETLQAIVDARPRDSLCRDETPIRYVLAPAPDLAWPIAVLAWEHAYTATCLDRPSIEAFFAEHYAGGPENTCALGVDLSSSGWCS